MSGRKRLPSTLLNIGQIYNGKMMDMGDQTYFMLEDKPIHKVRIHGVVIDRYDGVSSSGRQFCSLTLDDGSDTIRATVWSRPMMEEDVVVYDPIHVVEGIKIGDIVDVLGRVREYQDQLFISPNNIAVKDIEWEIHRRTELVKNYLQEHNLLVDPRPLFKEPSPSSTEQKSESSELMDSQPPIQDPIPPSDDLDIEEDLQEQILNAMSDDYNKNTIETIAKKVNQSKDLVQDAIHELQTMGTIYEPVVNKYAILDAPIQNENEKS